MSSYNENGMVLGDTRMSLTIARNSDTVQFGRDDRLLVDDYESKSVLAYRITKPLKVGGVYNGHGCLRFVMVEANTEDDDNLELHIANYYKYFPRRTDPVPVNPGDAKPVHGKKVWL